MPTSASSRHSSRWFGSRPQALLFRCRLRLALAILFARNDATLLPLVSDLDLSFIRKILSLDSSMLLFKSSSNLFTRSSTSNVS